MILDRLVLPALTVSTTLAGLSFVQLQERHYQWRFRRNGLHPYRASLAHGEVHYWAGGNPKGRPLLLVHGFGADALWGWIGQAQLARERFLIVPDLLWFGGSHAHGQDFSTRHQAEALIDLLDHLAVPEADVAGISYGGFVSLELAHGWPDRFRKLIVIDSPGHVFTLGDYRGLLERVGVDSIADLIVPPNADGVRRLVRLAWHRAPPVPMFVARDVYTHMFTSWTHEKVRLLDDLLARADTVRPDEYVIRQPTLLLWGDHDELFPPELAHRLARAIGPHARVKLVPNTNHAPNLERPVWFNREMRAFLAGA
jgi:pimeloyl-ACP methyl ester carboxylesterase